MKETGPWSGVAARQCFAVAAAVFDPAVLVAFVVLKANFAVPPFVAAVIVLARRLVAAKVVVPAFVDIAVVPESTEVVRTDRDKGKEKAREAEYPATVHTPQY